jgi:hypothetical protein
MGALLLVGGIGAVVTVLASPAAAASVRQPGVVYRSASDGLLYEIGTDGQTAMVGNGLGVAAGTKPAVAAMPSGGRMVAFHAGSVDTLWYVDANNDNHPTNYRLSPGTSPAMTTWSGDNFRIVFVNAADGLLWELTTNGTAFYGGAGYGVAPGTSPAIATIPDVGLMIAFNGGDGQLWYIDANNVGHPTGLRVAAGTSPAIAGYPGGYRIVFVNAADGLLWELTSNGTAFYGGAGYGLAPGTGPAITAVPNVGLVIAFHGGDGQLWYIGPNNVGHPTGLRMAAGTSPAVGPGPDFNWQVAFQDDTGHLAVMDDNGKLLDTNERMSAGNSPDLNTVLSKLLPFATLSPGCRCTGPTAALTSVANAARIRTRSVTSSVTLPPGLPATNPIDVEVQFGTAGLVHATYNPTLGTQIAFDFPVNDGGSRAERLVISLAERRPGGTVAMNFTTTVVIYPLFNIALSPLTFYLINDCDGIAGFPLDSEPFVSWADDRGADGVQFDLQAFDPRVINQFARSRQQVGVADLIRLPGLLFEEEDPEIPAGFGHTYATAGGLMLPGGSRHVHFEDQSRGKWPDEFCNAAFDYDLTINLVRYAGF